MKSIGVVGRIVVREDNVAGLFLPVGNSLKPGIYEVTNVLDEINVKYLGKQCESDGRFNALSLSELKTESACLMTDEEYQEYLKMD